MRMAHSQLSGNLAERPIVYVVMHGPSPVMPPASGEAPGWQQSCPDARAGHDAKYGLN